MSDFCPAYCRFCFRRRFTLSPSKAHHLSSRDDGSRQERETIFDIQEGLSYIAAHPEIDNVLLTGGDPLLLPPSPLSGLLSQLPALEHVRGIRIGSKIPAFDPPKLTDEFLEILFRYNLANRPLQVMLHFNHPREITPLACDRLQSLRKSGIPLYNQTPLLRGINDDPYMIKDLLNALVQEGVRPYYIFHCRPTMGNDHFQLSIQAGLQILEHTRQGLNGMAKSFRYVGSHTLGKIEIVGQLEERLVFRFHEARYLDMEGQLFTWPFDRESLWFDEAIQQSRLSIPSEL